LTRNLHPSQDRARFEPFPAHRYAQNRSLKWLPFSKFNERLDHQRPKCRNPRNRPLNRNNGKCKLTPPAETTTQISNKVALVTGAGSGIGRAAALALHSTKYSVVLAGRRAAELERTAKAASPSVARILVVPTDVSKPDAVHALFAQIKNEFGRLD